MQRYFHCGPLKNSGGVYYKEIEVDKVSDSDIILTNDNTPANTVTATATTNNLNYNNNNYNST